MRKLGAMTLAQVIIEGDAGCLPKAAHFVDVWLTRDLTDSEHVQARAVAGALGIDLIAFDAEQVAKEKNHE